MRRTIPLSFVSLSLAAACGPSSNGGGTDGAVTDAAGDDTGPDATSMADGTMAEAGSDAPSTMDGASNDAAADGSGEAGANCADAGPGTWDPQAVQVVGGSTVDARFALIGFDGAGNAIAIWREVAVGSGPYSLWAARRAPAGTWSAPQRLDSAGAAGLQDEPEASLAVSANGAAFVVYQHKVQTTGKGVWNPMHVEYAPASGWGTPAPLHMGVAPDQVGGSMFPRVAADSMGNAVCVWTEDVGIQSSVDPAFGPQVYAARYSGQWSTPIRLSSYAVDGFTQTPDVALDGAGNAVAAWAANPANSPVRVGGTHFDPGGTGWATEQFVDPAITGANVAGVPRVAFGAAGTAFAVWQEGISGATIASYGTTYKASTHTFATATQLDANLSTALDTSSGVVAADGAGNAIAVWHNASNDTAHPQGVYASRFAAGAWQAAVPLDGAQTGASFDVLPSLALDGAGNAVAVWNDQATVWATQFAMGTGGWSAAVQLDPQDTTASQPAVAISPGCPTAVVVYQNGTGTSSNGIFARTRH
jgi:hypothetical protein